MTIKVVEETCQIRETKISVSIISLENAFIVLVADPSNKYRIGTMALATPLSDRIGESLPSVVTLFGAGGELLAKALAGRTSTTTGKISLSIVGLRSHDNEIAFSVMKTVQGILEKLKVD